MAGRAIIGHVPLRAEAHPRRVEHDKAGFAVRLCPFTRKRELDEPRIVVIDPFIWFGRPVVASASVFGAQREAKRHAALDSADVARMRPVFPQPLGTIQSAVAAALCRRTPKVGGIPCSRCAPAMPEKRPPWPHAPTHQLSVRGTYFVTAGTCLKAHHFRGAERLRVLHRGLLTVARDFGWQLKAWAVFSNHYHFVAHSPPTEEDATSLGPMLGQLHERTAKWLNRLDAAPR